jgi:hypothetical protein
MPHPRQPHMKLGSVECTSAVAKRTAERDEISGRGTENIIFIAQDCAPACT